MELIEAWENEDEYQIKKLVKEHYYSVHTIIQLLQIKYSDKLFDLLNLSDYVLEYLLEPVIKMDKYHIYAHIKNKINKSFDNKYRMYDDIMNNKNLKEYIYRIEFLPALVMLAYTDRIKISRSFDDLKFYFNNKSDFVTDAIIMKNNVLTINVVRLSDDQIGRMVNILPDSKLNVLIRAFASRLCNMNVDENVYPIIKYVIEKETGMKMNKWLVINNGYRKVKIRHYKMENRNINFSTGCMNLIRIMDNFNTSLIDDNIWISQTDISIIKTDSKNDKIEDMFRPSHAFVKDLIKFLDLDLTIKYFDINKLIN